ncbi:MAG: hypothetical protein MUP41_07955 [Desulfobacterales bacterium]|nr:hypothetical protein [Desulfobacterales bacterium]
MLLMTFLPIRLASVDHGLVEQGEQVNTHLFWREVVAVGVMDWRDLRAFDKVDDLDRIALFVLGGGYPVIGDRDEPERKWGERKDEVSVGEWVSC